LDIRKKIEFFIDAVIDRKEPIIIRLFNEIFTENSVVGLSRMLQDGGNSIDKLEEYYDDISYATNLIFNTIATNEQLSEEEKNRLKFGILMGVVVLFGIYKNIDRLTLNRYLSNLMRVYYVQLVEVAE